jgi:hypothetical protein
LEQDGGASEPQETESDSEAEQEDPGGSPPAEAAPPAEGPRRLLVVGGAIAVVAVIAAIAFTVGGSGELGAPPASDDGELGGITLPTGDSSTSVADTAEPTAAPTPAPTPAASTSPPATTPVPTTPPPTPPPTPAPTSVPTTAPATAPPTTVAPGASGATTTVPGAVSIDSIVPNIAASRRHLSTPQEVQATIDQLLQIGGRHDVAIPGRVDTLCATVQLAGPIELSGRWEFEGDVIDETGVVLRSAPGFGDCLDNDGGPLEQGSYQYIATDVRGTDSAAATFYVGGVRIDQQFVNNGDEPVCAVFVAPSTSDYFEDFVFPSPLPPAASVLIPIADVPQDVEVLGCLGQNDERVLSDFDFNPTRGEPQLLFP